MARITNHEFFDVSAEDWLEDADQKEIEKMYFLCKEVIKRNSLNSSIEFEEKLEKIKKIYFKLTNDQLDFINSIDTYGI